MSKWERRQSTKTPLILEANFTSCFSRPGYAFCPPESTNKPIFPVFFFFSPGHRWPSPSVADTAHSARMHGAEAGSSHQTVPPDRASKSSFLCTIRQLTALLHFFLFSFLFPLFFNISTCSRGFFSPFSLFFSKNMWNWKHWELISREEEKKNTNPQQKTSNKLNSISVLVKHSERLLASLLGSLTNPLRSGARPAWIRWIVVR